MRLDVGGQEREGITAIAQNSDPFTYFGASPVRVCEDAALDNGTLSIAMLRRAAQRDVPTIATRVLDRAACESPSTARSTTSPASPRAASSRSPRDDEGRPGPSRSRSTATTSATTASSSWASSPGALTVVA